MAGANRIFVVLHGLESRLGQIHRHGDYCGNETRHQAGSKVEVEIVSEVARAEQHLLRLGVGAQLSSVQNHGTSNSRLPSSPQSDESFLTSNSVEGVEGVLISSALLDGQSVR